MTTTAKPTEKKAGKLDEIDKRLERLKENILPNAPYLMDLTAPSGYHVSPHQANNWRRGCPFDRHEEQLQYMTFLPHTLRGDTMLRTTGNWEDEDGKMKAGPAKPISGGSSGAISPSAAQQPKKKISLLDYKNKMAGQASGKTSPKAENNEKPSANVPLPGSQIMTESVVKSKAPTKAPEAEDNASAKPRGNASHGQKRSADAMADDKNAKIFGDPPASPPAKKQQTGASSNPNGAAPRIENGNIHGLPRMLSPTLPPSVEEQLAQLRGGEALSAKRARTATSEKRSAKPMVNGRVVADKPKPRPEAQGKEKGPETEEKRKASNRQSSAFATSSASSLSKATERQGKHQGKIEAPLKSKAGTVDIGKGLDSGAEPNGKDRPSGDASRKINQNDQPSLIVRLKIPKSLRKNCQRILQMQPRPRKLPGSFQMTPSSGPQDQSKERPSSNGSATGQAQQRKTNSGENSQGRSEAASKPKAVANGPSTPKPGEKRRQPDEDKDSSGQTSKRQRLSGAELQKPSTPQTSSLKSPNLPQSSSSQKARLSTPKNDLKSAAMRRIGSTEGEVKTPLGSIRSNTPTAPNSADRSGNRDGRSTSNVSSASTSIPTNKNDEGAFYKCEFTKHADLARSLKRAADALAKSKGGQINTDSVARREGLAIAIETTLCYMLAFTLKDESDRIKRLPNDRAAWVTLLPYFRFLKSLLRDDDSPHLQGFLYQLEAVCRETILQHDLERLEREPAAADEDSATFRKQMAENGKAVTQCWIDGSNLLSTEDLQEEYPDTWNKRSKGSLSSRGKEKLVPKRYGDGGFHLPLSNTSTSIEAVRAGWSFLAEWCKKEGVQWEGKMGL